MAPINPTISSLVATRAVAEIMRTPSSHLEDINYHIIIISSQAGFRAEGAGESALPAEESPWRLRALSRERELLEFYKKTASISSRERENRITLLAVVLILDPHLSYHLTFPLLSVGAVGDEGDPVWLCYPTILPELVKERTE